MTLRTKLLIVTFSTILFVQGISCFLEIGFLLNNLEENHIKKYQVIGKEVKRKLNKSLIFGKPLAHISYSRILLGVVPDDVENLVVIDPDSKPVYSFKPLADPANFKFQKKITQVKTSQQYYFYIPLKAKLKVKGNVVILVSQAKIKDRLFFLVKQALIDFIVVVVLTLPILYILLTLFINRPFHSYVRKLENLLGKEDGKGLKEQGIDISHLDEAEQNILDIKSGGWTGLDITKTVGNSEDEIFDQAPDTRGLKQMVRQILGKDE